MSEDQQQKQDDRKFIYVVIEGQAYEYSGPIEAYFDPILANARQKILESQLVEKVADGKVSSHTYYEVEQVEIMDV